MISPNRPDSQRLLALLARQRDHYRALRELSQQQRALISGDRPELLLNVLRDRQALVAALARLNEELSPYRRNWDATYAALAEPAKLEASELLRETNELLRVILRTDQEDSALLSVRKQTVAREIGELTGGRSANTAYARGAAPADTSARADVTG